MAAVGVGEVAQHSLAECLVFRVELFRPDVLEKDHRAGAVVGGGDVEEVIFVTLVPSSPSDAELLGGLEVGEVQGDGTIAQSKLVAGIVP